MECAAITLIGSLVLLVRAIVAAPLLLAFYAVGAALTWRERRRKRAAWQRYRGYVDALRPLRLPHYVVLQIVDLAEPDVDATETEKLCAIDRRRVK